VGIPDFAFTSMHHQLAATSACQHSTIELRLSHAVWAVFMHINEWIIKNAHSHLSVSTITQQWL